MKDDSDIQLANKIVKEICYTELVYGRVNKKLNAELDRKQIEELVRKSVLSSDKIERHGKNYYVYNGSAKIEITINANNYRVITVNKYIENN